MKKLFIPLAFVFALSILAITTGCKEKTDSTEATTALTQWIVTVQVKDKAQDGEFIKGAKVTLKCGTYVEELETEDAELVIERQGTCPCSGSPETKFIAVTYPGDAVCPNHQPDTLRSFDCGGSYLFVCPPAP